VVARRSNPLEAAEKLERVAHEIRQGARPLDPELALALEHELERRPQPDAIEIPAWQRVLLREAYADMESGNVIAGDALKTWFADLKKQQRRRQTDRRR
jgi:hypothetical protein